MTGLSIRTATGEDVQALVALVNSAFRGESSKIGWTTEADLLGGQRVDIEGLTETLRTPGNAILILEGEGAPVGCVHLRRTGEECYLGMLTILPVRQGAGLGRRLLQAAENWAFEHWSVRSVHLTVIAQRRELIVWYERRGYIRTGERRPFPYGNERFGLPRRSDLEFEVLRKDLTAGL